MIKILISSFLIIYHLCLGEKILETYENEINISNLSKGVYLIKVDNISIRLIKQ